MSAKRLIGAWRSFYDSLERIQYIPAHMRHGLFPSAIKLTRSAHEAGHYDGAEETEEAFNNRYVAYFDRKDIDNWELRQRMNNILGMDLIPDPSVIRAGLLACRHVNDIALAIRWMEACKDKCGDRVGVVFPYIMQEIRPTLRELGVPTLEELKYDKPELALQSVFDM